MPNPTRGDVHVNRPLTNISIAYLQRAIAFISSQVFPNIPVQKQSDSYFTYSRADFNRDEATQRAPGAESAGGGYRLDADATYSCRVNAYHKDVADQIRNNADSPLNLDREASEYVTLKALLRREIDWVSKYFAAGIWDTDMTGVAAGVGAGEVLQWNDEASLPLQDVATGQATILEATGFKPNCLCLGYRVWNALRNHPDILDRIKYSSGNGSPAIASKEAVAALLEIDRIMVSEAIQNTADEGAAEVSSLIAGKKALLCYAAPSPGIMTPSAGYTFSWVGHTGAGPDGNVISKFRLDRNRADRVEIEFAFDHKLVSSALGYFWDTVVA